MHILITGGAGFIGSHLSAKLLREHCRVTVMDNLYSGLRENVPADANFVRMDVRDRDLASVFAREKFDAAVHLAGQTMVSASLDDPHNDASVNIEGTVNLLEECRKSGVKRVIFASTAAVYGDAGQMPIAESTAARPTSFYGLSKLTVERYLALYRQLYGLEYVALRFANVYGERQGEGGEGGVISIFAKAMASGRPVAIFGDGGQTRDFIYAGDVACGIWRAIYSREANDVFNLSTKTETSVNEVLRLLGEIAGKQAVVERYPARAGDIYRSFLDHDKAVQALSWSPQTTLEEGLKKTYQYFADAEKKS